MLHSTVARVGYKPRVERANFQLLYLEIAGIYYSCSSGLLEGSDEHSLSFLRSRPHNSVGFPPPGNPFQKEGWITVTMTDS